MKIGEKIKKFREEKKMSKSELARKINVSPSYITMLENGNKTNPSSDVIFKIAIALGITIGDLLDDTEDNSNTSDLFNLEGCKPVNADFLYDDTNFYQKILNIINTQTIKDDDPTMKLKSALTDYLKYKNTSNNLGKVNKLLTIIDNIIDYSKK